MRRSVPGYEGLAAELQTVRRACWRWECQGSYAVDGDEVDRWRRGLPAIETDDDRAWIDYIHRLRDAGIPFERVRLLTEPVNDYLRWMLDTTDRNTDAGEDIRWITPAAITGLGLPDYDFYLIDNQRVVILNFDTSQNLLGIEVDDDDTVVRQHQQWRDLVWPLAIPHATYHAGHR